MKRSITAIMVGSVLLGLSGLSLLVWFTCRIYVPPDKCAVMVRRTGKELPQGQSVAFDAGQKGIQQKVLGPGRHFRNLLWTWDYELVDLTVVPAGNPATWEWIHSLDESQRDALRSGEFKFRGDFPKIGVVTRKIGKPRIPGQVLVKRESGMEGILEEVLTPGTYKLNPHVFDVQIHPSTVIPSGFVGVVTNLFGEQSLADAKAYTSISLEDENAAAGEDDAVSASRSRPLAKVGERGTQPDVLQPGVYFINPRKLKVTLIEIGYNEYSQIKESEANNFRISFPSDTGYVIRVGVTLVWGIHPRHAAEIINDFGNIDRVLDKIIGPQLRSICRNIGSTYTARDFIQGEKRERFQHDLTGEMRRVCEEKNIEILLALIREIEVLAPTADPDSAEVTEDLKRTIQQSYIAIEKQITNSKQRDAAAVRAQLEEERKKVEIAKETITADTRVMVAKILADAEKQAAEIDAQAQLEIANIQQEVALLDASKIEILGQAKADVDKLKRDAEAQGYEMLVAAVGGGEAYNLYTFAESFNPESIRIFYAGEGTFWTDLSGYQDLSAARVLEQAAKKD